MANDTTTDEHAPIIFDGWRSISISLYMALVVYSVMVSVPVLSTALVGMAGFTEEQVGGLAGGHENAEPRGFLSAGAGLGGIPRHRLGGRPGVIRLTAGGAANAVDVVDASGQFVTGDMGGAGLVNTLD